MHSSRPRSLRARAASRPLALVVLAGGALAQNVSTLVLEGDPGPGGTAVVEIENLAVNSSGDWFVEVELDDADTTRNAALYRSGLLYLQKGDALVEPAGATVTAFDAVTLDAASHGCFDFTLGNTGSTADNGGVYFDAELVLQKGAVSGAAGFGPGTVYGTFSDCKLNDAGQILVVGLVDDPNVTGTTDWACVRLDTDGAGNLIGETRIAGEGDLLPGQTLVVNTIRSGPHASAFNHLGDVIFGADLDTGSPPSDAVVYLNSTLLAQEGMPSGVPGRNWGDLVSPEVDLNVAGDWTIKDRLDNTDTSTDGIIVKNGAKFVQEGDALAAIAPFTLADFGNGPAALTEAGDVLWFGRWDDPDTTFDEGLFLNDVLLIQEGATTIGGLVVIDVGDQSENYAISDDGAYVVFEATLDGGLEGAFLLVLSDPPTAYCFGDGTGTPCPCVNEASPGEGCANSSGQGGLLSASGSTSAGADDLAFDASQLLPGQPALLFAGLNAVNGGLGQPFGDGLRCAGGGVVRLGVDVPDGNGDASWGPGLGASGGWGAGDTRHFQTWYRDPSGSPCGTNFNLTHGVTVVFVR